MLKQSAYKFPLAHTLYENVHSHGKKPPTQICAIFVITAGNTDFYGSTYYWYVQILSDWFQWNIAFGGFINEIDQKIHDDIFSSRIAILYFATGL